jgi:beta-lactam-binding protein with PASTA domain
MSLKKAQSTLEKVNLSLGRVDEDYSDTYKKGAVMWQQYKKGKKLSEGQTVDIKISKGPEDKTSTVSVDIDYSRAQSDNFKLTVLLVLKDGSEKPIIDNKDRIKANGGESVKVTGKGPGAKVIWYFDAVQAGSARVDFNTKEVSY